MQVEDCVPGALVWFPWDISHERTRMGQVVKLMPPIDGRPRVEIDNKLCYFIDELEPVTRVRVNTHQYDEEGDLWGFHTIPDHMMLSRPSYYYDIHLDIFPAESVQWFMYDEIEGVRT